MLVSKFLTNYRNNHVNKMSGAEYDIKVHTFVNREFEKFIELQSFTQNKLAAFEDSLRKKLREDAGLPEDTPAERMGSPKIDVDLKRM